LPFSRISNIVFDKAAALTVAGVTVSAGVISFISIIFRTFLCVTAVLILIAVTPFSQLTGQLRRMRFPTFLSIYWRCFTDISECFWKKRHHAYGVYAAQYCA
jgi:cobalt/nickel transport system permease protein